MRNFLADSYRHGTNVRDVLRNAREYIFITVVLVAVDIFSIGIVASLHFGLWDAVGSLAYVALISLTNIAFMLVSLPGVKPRGLENVIFIVSHYARLIGMWGLIGTWVVKLFV